MARREFGCQDIHPTDSAIAAESIVHFFVNSAITELALLRAAEDDVADRRREFWLEALRLRDLPKFEFFFVAERRKAFAVELREVIRRVDAVAALAASRRAGLID